MSRKERKGFTRSEIFDQFLLLLSNSLVHYRFGRSDWQPVSLDFCYHEVVQSLRFEPAGRVKRFRITLKLSKKELV